MLFTDEVETDEVTNVTESARDRAGKQTPTIKHQPDWLLMTTSYCLMELLVSKPAEHKTRLRGAKYFKTCSVEKGPKMSTKLLTQEMEERWCPR